MDEPRIRRPAAGPARRDARAGALGAAALALVAACSKGPGPEASPPAPSAPAASQAPAATPYGSVDRPSAAPADGGVAWRKPHGEAEVDALFAEARERRRPVFLYWGADWCPPCNQVKATLFTRPDFVEKSRAFVPIYLDGDLPGAQKLGERFRVRGYPTMVLLRPDGSELTRLPGEVDAERYLQVMTFGLEGARPVSEVLAQARRAPGTLGAEDWRRLAYYGWDTDEQQLLPQADMAATLQRLAADCPREQAEAGTRLLLKALAARAEAEPAARPARGVAGDAAARERLLEVLADDALTRRNVDLVTMLARPLSRTLAATGTPEHEQLVATWGAALDRLTADRRLSQGDRIAALAARVELARAEEAPGGASAAEAAAPLGPVLLEHVRAQVARADREMTDPVERQSVIPNAADVLAEAGLGEESDRLLESELKRSIAPYYAMLGLAANARARGDRTGALAWYERAYAAAQGPATRVQWGGSYVNALVELAPRDAPRIEAAARQVLEELRSQPDAFYARSLTRLEKMSRALLAWSRDGAPAERRAEVLGRLRAQRDALCAALPETDPQRAACRDLLAGAAAPRPHA